MGDLKSLISLEDSTLFLRFQGQTVVSYTHTCRPLKCSIAALLKPNASHAFENVKVHFYAG